MRKTVTVLNVFVWLAVFVPAFVQQAEAESFYSTWKLLSTAEKKQFAAGYLHGWKDAKKVNDIAVTYIRENPATAVDSVERIAKLYDVSTLRPDNLVESLDAFYDRPENKAAPLSAAVTAAKTSP